MVATGVGAAAALIRAASRGSLLLNKTGFRKFSVLTTFSRPSCVLMQSLQGITHESKVLGFSTSAANDALSGTIRKEIAHEKSQYEADKELRAFVEKNEWTLEDKPNDMLVVLSKEVDGRRVSVEFSCIQPSGAEDGEPLPEASDFTVCVTNKNGSGLLFYCSTTAEEGARFCIGQVRHFDDHQAKDSLAEYPGPYFEDLDDAFQQHLDSWLASLGIDSDLCDFVDRYASDKENREYIRWLAKLEDFVK